MMRVRIACAAVVAAVALGVVGAPAAVAKHSNGTNSSSAADGLYTLPVSGAGKNGKKFTGTYTIQRFVAKNGKAWSVGTLKGKLKNRHVSRSNVMMPAALQSGENGQGARAAQATCTVLNLVLGPIDLNLLGLRVQLGAGQQLNQPIVLRITAQQGGGLLGDLLCGLTNALNGQGALDQLNGNLQQLTATLNGLVSLLGGLPPATP